MSRNPAIRAYCRQVGKALELPKVHRRRLLAGLERELEERFSSVAGLTPETLCIDAGSPEESASALMECVDAKERIQHQSQRKLLIRTTFTALIVFLVVLIILSATYFSYLVQYSVDHTEIKIVQSNIE